jgi:hypothetical protein
VPQLVVPYRHADTPATEVTGEARRIIAMCRLTRTAIAPLASFVLAAFAFAQEPPTPTPAAAARLEISTLEWNFGEVWQGQPLMIDVAVSNVGDAPLEFVEVKSSCGCTVPTKPRSPLLPGEADTMTISYDSKKRVGAAQQSVTIITNDAVRPNVSFQVRGTVKAVYEVEPKEGLVFGQLFESAQSTRTVRITNRYKDPLTLRLKEPAEGGPYRLELKEVEPGQRWELTARTTPPLPVGRFSATVALETGLELMPEIGALVYGFVQAPVSVRPSKLYLPKNSVAEIKRTVWVAHAPDHPLEITGVRASDESIKVELGPTTRKAEGETLAELQIIVTLPPGDRIVPDSRPRVEISTNSPNEAYQTLTVPVQIIDAPQGVVSENPVTVGRAQATTAPSQPAEGPTSRSQPPRGQRQP